MSKKRKAIDNREEVIVNVAGALLAVLNKCLSVPMVHVALATYLEGAELKGDYRLEITGAKLVPVKGE